MKRQWNEQTALKAVNIQGVEINGKRIVKNKGYSFGLTACGALDYLRNNHGYSFFAL